jgi:hypothetical protein
VSGHTPGPWTFIEHGYPTTYHVHGFVEGSDRAPVCGLWMPAEQKDIVEEGRANARLIAAAPDLLEALRYLHPESGLWTLPTDEWEAKIEDAIAKAEGK